MCGFDPPPLCFGSWTAANSVSPKGWEGKVSTILSQDFLEGDWATMFTRKKQNLYTYISLHVYHPDTQNARRWKLHKTSQPKIWMIFRHDQPLWDCWVSSRNKAWPQKSRPDGAASRVDLTGGGPVDEKPICMTILGEHPLLNYQLEPHKVVAEVSTIGNL